MHEAVNSGRIIGVTKAAMAPTAVEGIVPALAYL